MTTIIKIKSTSIKALMLLCVISATFSCSNANNNTPKANVTAESTAVAENSITIDGTVKKITFGKDGYTADVQTDNDGIYAALVSISNLGGPDNYKTCEVGDKVSFKGMVSTSSDIKSLIVKEIVSIGSTDTQMSIESNGFRDIQVGDAIKKYSNVDYVKKAKLKVADGTFEAYEIRDFENNPAGYFLPDPNNKLLVGDITIETPKASTAKGIKVGDSFKDLLRVYPNIEVHGSESEGRTYATEGSISYRLDVPNFSYDVDKSKIPAKAKITQIVISKK